MSRFVPYWPAWGGTLETAIYQQSNIYVPYVPLLFKYNYSNK